MVENDVAQVRTFINQQIKLALVAKRQIPSREENRIINNAFASTLNDKPAALSAMFALGSGNVFPFSSFRKNHGSESAGMSSNVLIGAMTAAMSGAYCGSALRSSLEGSMRVGH